MKLTWLNGRLTVGQHIFSDQEMKNTVGTLWVPTDGSSALVVIRKVSEKQSPYFNRMHVDITFEYLQGADSSEKEYTKDAFNFQTRYKLVIMQLGSPDSFYA